MTDVSPLWMPNAPRLKDALQERKDRREQGRREDGSDHGDYAELQDADGGPSAGKKGQVTEPVDERPKGGKEGVGRILDIEV